MTNRMDHIAKHLRGLQFPEDMETLIPLLCSTMTLEEIAREVPGLTPNTVRARIDQLTPRLCLPSSRAPGAGILRLALCRLFYGIDPCWCEQ